MWQPKSDTDKKDERQDIVAVAIDKDKSSQGALKWAVEHILQRGQTVILIHVNVKSPTSLNASAKHSHSSDPRERENALVNRDPDQHIKELFLPFRCFCTRKDIQCRDIVLDNVDVSRAIIEYIDLMGVQMLVVGSSSKSGFLRFKVADIPTAVSKGAPDFCSVFVISKGKVTSIKPASRAAPPSQLLNRANNHPNAKPITPPKEVNKPIVKRAPTPERPRAEPPRKSSDEVDFFRSPLTRKGVNSKTYELSMPETDISFVSSGRPSVDRLFPSFYSNSDPSRNASMSEYDNNHSFESMHHGRKSIDVTTPNESFESTSQSSDDVEAEMRRLKLELKQTMEMYSSACKEALTAKQKARELQLWKMEEERRLEEARLSEEAALAMAEMEKAKSKAAIEHAEAAQRLAELEAMKRKSAEMKVIKEAEEKKRALAALNKTDFRYRRYAIEEIEAATNNFDEAQKIGEGGYGPVYKCILNHTSVAIKVLRPDAAQGRSQFQQEVEVLSCIRHPNMVLLLGACPEYGCLVYEFMANGSLDDRLFRRGNTPPIPWQLRFRIAAEIGTGLLFLHQSKPEPLVHRDLKPANILLDRNFVSKISDVGLARLVPPSVADNVTQYRMTSTAGTFCYIDPEYQQTGMLGIKSDVYSLGIMFLQILTAKPPMGLTHYVDRALEKDNLEQIIDPAVPDWPIEEAKQFARLALKCAELRRKDRPDLGKVILPELNRLRAFAEDSLHHSPCISPYNRSPIHSQVSIELVSPRSHTKLLHIKDDR